MFKSIIGAAGGVALALASLQAGADDRGYAKPDLLLTAETLAVAMKTAAEDPTRTDGRPDLVVVDVRPHADYLGGHIPGARHIEPNAVADPDAPVDGALRSESAIAAIFSDLGISAQTRVVFYDDKGGFHAARMFWLAEHYGHRKVSLLDGGIQAWQADGGSLETGTSSSSPSVRFEPAIAPRRYASADYILAHEDNVETVVIDVRPPDLFAKGHIPWAESIPWSANLNADGTMKSAADLAAHFEGRGVTKDRNIVIHCQNGLASAHSYVALRLLGYPKVRVYHRSWAEWGSTDDLPKAAHDAG